MPLTPKNRKEQWLEGLIQHETALTPKNRPEAWMKEIIDASGGGGTGGGVLVVNDNNGTLDKTWKEISDAFDAGVLVHAYRNEDGLFSKEIITMLITNNTDMFGVSISGYPYTTNTENGYPVSGK